MKFTKTYERTLFEESEIRQAILELKRLSKNKPDFGILKIDRNDHSWELDTLDDFFSEYNNGFNHSFFASLADNGNYGITLSDFDSDFLYKVQINAPNKSEINDLISVFDNVQDRRNIDNKYASYRKPPIFIGHGHKQDWKDLRDHLRDKHNYSFKYYESADRSSGYVFENVAEMIDSSKLSILVLSKDDTLKDGKMRSRQNVIHELGYSQAIQGRSNTLIVIEKGCDWPSNIQGIDVFYYDKSIREIQGDLVAAIEKRFFDFYINNQ